MSDFIEDGSIGGQNIRGYMDNERLDKIKDAKCEDLFDMDRKDFELYIYSLRKLAENNVESNRSFMTALVRWKYKDNAMVSPGEFIPVVEKNGLIIDVDVYVWTRVFSFLGRRIAEGIYDFHG